jgi:hypothetical protein
MSEQPGVSHRLHQEVVAHHAERAEAAERQRDELLAALKRIDSMADEWHGPCPGIQDVARSAISRVETVIRILRAEGK